MGFVADSEEPRSTGRFVPERRNSAPVQSAPQKEIGLTDLLAPADIIAAVGSGAIAQPLSGLAGLFGAALPGAAGQSADWQRKVQDAMTYQPRTTIGQKSLEIAGVPFDLLHKSAVAAGNYAQDKGASPIVSTALQTGIEVIPQLALAALTRLTRPTSSVTAESLNSVRDATYKAARDEGYKFPTSASNETFIGNRIEGAAGRPMLNQEMTLNNQTVTNKIAAREAGLPENTAITPGRLEARRQQLADPYREAAQIDPAVAQDVLDMRKARADSQKYYKFFDRHPDPMVEQTAQKFEQKAAFLETQIEQAAQNAGKPDLMQRIRKARVEIAKTYDIENALNEGTGDVSASKIAAMLDRGKPLSAGLETIGKTHQAFRPYMGNATSIANPGVERIRGAIGIAANAMGAHGGIGWLSEGIPMAAGPIRSGIMTDWYQNKFGKPAYPQANWSPLAISGVLQGQENKQRK